MFEKLANIFRIPDLRKRILFTLGMLAVYRLAVTSPRPGSTPTGCSSSFDQNRGTLLGFVDLFSGGNLRRLTIFALGIMPYITASIILQLLTVVYEPLAKLQKEGELGRKKITAVDPLPDGDSQRDAVFGDRDQPGAQSPAATSWSIPASASS